MIHIPVQVDREFTMKSYYYCNTCSKHLLKNLYVTLNDQDHSKTDRFCYGCFKENFGLDLAHYAKKEVYDCLYCEKSLINDDLLVEQSKYYIFTDMADAKQIIFCKECFEKNAPK